jgi:hypothetical protein
MFPPTEMDVEVVYDADGYNKVISNLRSAAGWWWAVAVQQQHHMVV